MSVVKNWPPLPHRVMWSSLGNVLVRARSFASLFPTQVLLNSLMTIATHQDSCLYSLWQKLHFAFEVINSTEIFSTPNAEITMIITVNNKETNLETNFKYLTFQIFPALVDSLFLINLRFSTYFYMLPLFCGSWLALIHVTTRIVDRDNRQNNVCHLDCFFFNQNSIIYAVNLNFLFITGEY